MTQPLVLSGEQTIYQAAELHRMMREALSRNENLDVDLSGVIEFDSAAAQLMIWLQREGQRRGLRIRLLAPAGAVLDLVALLGLGGTLTFEEASA